MKKVKKLIISACFCLLAGLVSFGGTADVQAAPAGQGTTTVSYISTGTELTPPSGTTTVDKGVAHPAAVQTGDRGHTGQYSLLLAGSAAAILLVLFVREFKERVENQF